MEVENLLGLQRRFPDSKTVQERSRVMGKERGDAQKLR